MSGRTSRSKLSVESCVVQIVPMNDGLLDHIANGTTPNRFELAAIPRREAPARHQGQRDDSRWHWHCAADRQRRVPQDSEPAGQHAFSSADCAERVGPPMGTPEKPLIDAGIKDYDEASPADALDPARSTCVMRNVHNLTDRTQWTVTLRNWAPFYFAQEQAYRRMGRLLAEDPRAFRQYQLMISNIGNTGQIFQGPNSKGYFVMPGTGWLSGSASFLGALAMAKIPVLGACQPDWYGLEPQRLVGHLPALRGCRPG